MTYDSLISSLNEMLHCFQNLRHLLDEDKHSFSKNKMDSIEESNQKKSAALERLAFIVNDFNEKQTGQPIDNLLESINKDAQRLHPNKQQEVLKITKKLEAEMMECYESLAINNKIVFSNIQKLKEFWGKVGAFKSEGECVYDAKASTK